jgi:Na+-transporting NADH:ubiquinone oxidoreductase subunit F
MVTFLIAVGVLCGISAVLAVALVLADRYVNDYGLCKIDINNGSRELEVDGGGNLLGVLSAQKIFIPSACGGRGSCGLCKLKIMDGGGPVLPTEEPHLSKEERAASVRLSCQVKVRNDLKIEIPEELFNIREYHAEVAGIEDLTYDIKRVTLALRDPDAIKFTPGQYVQLECPVYKMSPEPVYRAYSVASDPDDQHQVELIIRLVPNGICTTWVFDFMQQGDSVKINGPYGDFRLQDSGREMIFIAGGSGMAPFCSMLATMKKRQDPRKTRYFFGAKAVKDLFYVDKMKQFETELPDFKFIPALSEPAPEDDWQGETGLITEVVGNHYQDCSDKEAYLCGSPGMIDACLKVLKERGMTEEYIFFDKFA